MISARVTGLALQGFRRFQEPAQFNFVGPDGAPPNTLVIAGPNGSGKTSVFEAILYALGQEEIVHRELRKDDRERWFQNALATDASVQVTLDVTSASGTILGTLAPGGIEVMRSRKEWTIRAGQERKTVTDDIDVVRSVVVDVGVQWFSSWRQPYLCGPVKPMADVTGLASGEALRLREVKQRIIDERARTAFRTGPGRDENWLQRLEEAWKLLRGEAGERFAIGPSGPENDATHFDVFIQRSIPGLGDDLVCSIDQLSSGELEWLILIGTLITTEFAGIVLIDEPELHLHPEWQARLLPALRSVMPDSQFVLATHADPPWDQVYSFERLLLVPPGDPRYKRPQ